MTVVRARGLVRGFGSGRGSRRVLDGLDLDVEPGELVVVSGRSGSGKSTLLQILGGLDWPEAGTVELAGRPLEARRDAAGAGLRLRYVGFVFQAFHLVPELTGRENVELPTRLRGAAPGGAERARRLVSDLGLDPVADHRPHELSGGEQQRFAIARALVNDPRLVLADEPTGNLDSAAGEAVLDLLRAMAAGARAVVLVTHDAPTAARADRHVRLEDGRLRAA